MEDPISSGPKSSFIRFSQKLSSLIHRKSKDDSSVVKNSPYRRQDNNKLCMSQPILVLSKPTQPDTDADDTSDHSTSLDLLATYHAPIQDHIIGHPRKASAQSNSSGLIFPDGLTKKQSKSVNASSLLDGSVSNSLKPGAPIMPPRSNSVKLISESSSKPSPRITTGSLPMPPANSDGHNVQVTTSNLKFNTGADRPGRIMHDSTPTLPGRRDIGPSRHEYSQSRGDRVATDVIIDVDDNSNNRSTINTASSQLPPSPISPRRASSAPRLSLPPANYRFSLNLVDGYSARMSPSVILRPPPLPLFNLPVLPDNTSSTLDASSRRSKRAGLLSMPALPRHGSSRGTNGREELDDVEDEDEDEDGDGDGDDDGDGNNTSPEDELDTHSDGSNSETAFSPHSGTPSTSSFETAHECSSPHDHEGYFDITGPLEKDNSPPFLPPLDMSQMSQIDLSFLDSSPLGSSPLDDKNKGKAKALTADAGRTPIATRPNRRGAPTALRLDFETKTDAWAASPVITKGSSPTQTLRPGSYFNLPLTQGGQSSSPTQTPRPDLNFPLSISKGGYFNPPLTILTPPSPSSPRPLPTRSTESRSSVLSMNSITRFPGTYHVASKSLIDVHAVEKKEKVEQMLREEEESAEEERKRRVKAKRMSMRVATTMSHQQSDGQLNASPSIRMQSPHWIDNDSVKTSEASSSSSPTAKQPKRTNNRISMAPAYETVIPLRRRLSMPTFNATSTAPPPYPDLFPNAQSYGVKLAQVQPRDDEGREKLPAYSNSIYVKAIMPRKLEFVRPGVQAKDRKWRRVLCVLEGTSFKVYKPPGVSVIGGWWENRVGVGDITAPTTATPSSAGESQMARRGDAGGASGAARKTKEEIEREIEMMRYIMANQPSQSDNANQRRGSSPTTSGSSHPFPNRSDGPVTKSALQLAVHLLSPSSRGHARTVSDVGQSSNTPSVPQMPRSSLNILMNGRSTPTSSFSSSRSQSPMFAASSSSLLTTPAGSRSHHSRASSTSGGTVLSAASSSSSSSTSKGKKKAEDFDLLPDKRSLIKAYTMQNAESGLGTDYVKRKHVIRVRLEGEQFLLQASDVDSVIEWIEGLQAATNIAMDLDERVMPRGPPVPRRRRRRRANAPGVLVYV